MGVYIGPMRSQPDLATLDGLLDASVRRLIEQRFWEPVEASASIEVLRHDERFLLSCLPNLMPYGGSR